MANTGRPQGQSKSQSTGPSTGHSGQGTGTGQGSVHKPPDLAAAGAQKAGQATAAVGEQLTSLAGTIRQKAPHDGMMGSAATSVADTLQAGGRYLQQHDLDELAGHVASLVRRYPMQSILAGLGVGFLLGTTLHRR